MIDCRLSDGFELMSSLQSKVVDLVLTDLPYKETANKWDQKFDYDLCINSIERLLQPNGTFITFASIELASKLIQMRPKWFKYEIIWIKNKPTGFLNAKKKVLDNHELILVFTKNLNKYTYNPQKNDWSYPSQ